jgi:uncharacterized protein YjiS (DUF1127 family)
MYNALTHATARDTLTQAAARIIGPLLVVIRAVHRQYRQARLISALQLLSDAELKDIGVYRCEIPYIAQQRCMITARS